MEQEGNKAKWAQREWDRASGRGSCARAVHWCAGASEGRGAGERNAAAASNDRARVASFTRSAARPYYSRAPPPPPSIPRSVLHGPLGCDARFSTRSPLQKLSAPHSATALSSLSHSYTRANSFLFHTFLRLCALFGVRTSEVGLKARKLCLNERFLASSLDWQWCWATYGLESCWSSWFNS